MGQAVNPIKGLSASVESLASETFEAGKGVFSGTVDATGAALDVAASLVKTGWHGSKRVGGSLQTFGSNVYALGKDRAKQRYRGVNEKGEPAWNVRKAALDIGITAGVGLATAATGYGIYSLISDD